MALPRVAYYAHHHGSGHLRHALNIARLETVELLVTGSVEPDGITGPHTRFAGLTTDTHADGRPDAAPTPFLHYTPTTGAVRKRFTELHSAWQDFDPQVVIVDVSVEAAVFARLCGYPVLYRRMPGHRTDTPHQTAYAASGELFAYYPRSLEDPAYEAHFGNRTEYLGMLEPAGGESAGPAGGSRHGNVVAVQTSLGGAGVGITDLTRAARLCPAWQWEVMGVTAGDQTHLPGNLRLLGVVDDARLRLETADLIITSAGHHAVAAAAAANRPTILVPEERPFDEQLCFARALGATAGVPVAEQWGSADWPGLLRQAASADPTALRRTLLVSQDTFQEQFMALIARTTG